MTNKALLIANGTYPEESGLRCLNGPENDIEAMQSALEHPQYGLFKDGKVVCCKNYEKVPLHNAIEDFLRDTSRGDFVLLYYSGHGLRPGERLHFATKDTVKEKLYTTALSTSVILDLLNEVNRAEQTMFILDCCYAGGAFEEKGDATDVLQKTFPGRWSLYSSPATQTSKDGPESEASRFTKALTDALTDPKLGPDDDQGYVYLDTVFNQITRTLEPKPLINIAQQAPIPIARRGSGAAKGGTPVYAELQALQEPDDEIPHDIVATVHDTTVMRHLAALLDLAGEPQTAHHRETIGSVRSFVGEFLRRHGVSDAVLDQIGASLSPSRLTRLVLRCDDVAVAQLPWEYLEVDKQVGLITPGPLALRKNLVIERRSKPAKLLSPPSEDRVEEVTFLGIPTGTIPCEAEEALRQDLAYLKVQVNVSNAGKGLTFEEIAYRFDCPPVLVVLAAMRRITTAGKDHRVYIRLAGAGGEGWMETETLVNDVFGLNAAARSGQAPFRAIVIETFATEPGDDAQSATAELASSLTALGIGNVVFLCHPPGFGGYKPAAGLQRIRTFTGHLVGALNSGASMPHAFYAARSRMQVAFPQRCDHEVGIPGLYIPEYAVPRAERDLLGSGASGPGSRSRRPAMREPASPASGARAVDSLDPPPRLPSDHGGEPPRTSGPIYPPGGAR